MIKAIFSYFICIAFFSCTQSSTKAQNKSPQQAGASQQKVGGSCEGCEAIYESKIPFDALNETDTLPIFNEAGQKLVVSGTVYKSDGKTPAPDVVLYVYHTDQTGKYRIIGNENGWGRRHGSIRGWVKTNAQGHYKFYTIRPASYSKTGPAAHIHVTVKEPDKNEYWIDEFHFDDDPFLKEEERKRFQNRGGDGVVQVKERAGVFYVKRNICLGKNVEDYPSVKKDGMQSGLAIGDNCPAFDPIHLSGADVNKGACPMCKYGYGQGVIVWFNHTSLDKLKRFARLMEDEMKSRGEKSLRVFLVYMNPMHADNDAESQRILREKIKKWCGEQFLQRVAMLWVPSPTDEETSGVYHINPKADNTVFLYKKRKVAAKWVNIDYSDEAVKMIVSQL